MKKTIGYVLSHTHWDREWYLSFQLFRMRLVDMLDTLIPYLEQHPEFPHFHLDGQTVCLEDYLEVRPEQAERLQRLIEAGRIAVGPWYVLPDLQCIGQESILRNLSRGLALAQRFGGGTPVGYLPDIFSHPAQMPQIFAGYGFRAAVIWRGSSDDPEPPYEVLWRAPDGTQLLTLRLPDDRGYTDWYLPLIDAGKSMPDAIGEDAPEEAVPTEGSQPTSPDAAASGGDGIVTEEQVQKGYVWMNEVNKNIFYATYDDIVAYFGVEGQFVKEEYSDHMKANYRYYKWISEDDDSHFIYVNFKENESGVYTVSAYNTSGFSGTEAIEKYLDVVKAEAAEANKAASANAEMKDFSVEIAQFAKDDVKVKIMTKIPVSGWSYDDGPRCLVENDDPTAFGAGAIQFEVRETVEKFDSYKDKFENYQDIEDRVIGGITFRGRTYKYIGYEWIQYIAQLDDNRALSIGLRNMDCVPGTMPDIILNNMTFQ